MPHTPVPNLRRAEWLDRLVRKAEYDIRPRNRRRTAKKLVTWVLGLLAAGLAREVWTLSTQRMGWTAPPGRSGDRLGAERVERRQ